MKPLITNACFSFGPSQGIFGMGLGMQKNWEVFANWLVAQRNHLLSATSDDHIINVIHRDTHNSVPYCSANGVYVQANRLRMD